MKFKTDDAVWYDDDPGVVVSGWPGNDHLGYTYLVYWPASGWQTEIWESDLIADKDYLAK